jgi:hypothetical protein
VSKNHVGNAKGVKLNMKIFFYQAIESIKTLKIESIGYNVGGHQEIHQTLWALKMKIFYILYFFELRIVGKHRKDVGGHLKGPHIYF